MESIEFWQTSNLQHETHPLSFVISNFRISNGPVPNQKRRKLTRRENSRRTSVYYCAASLSLESEPLENYGSQARQTSWTDLNSEGSFHRPAFEASSDPKDPDERT